MPGAAAATHLDGSSSIRTKLHPFCPRLADERSRGFVSLRVEPGHGRLPGLSLVRTAGIFWMDFCAVEPRTPEAEVAANPACATKPPARGPVPSLPDS
ncbi:MAG TPA: hypothetical protein DEP35_20305 [Deltaproteobacteria bacterium]|nr:hypothetical protein [Deltaproteobacteria bacterium]